MQYSKIKTELCFFFALFVSTNLQASASRDYGLLEEKPSITANSLEFAAYSSLTSIYSFPWSHNMPTKNKSINVCIFGVPLHPSIGVLKKSKCKDVVNWFDKNRIVAAPPVFVDFSGFEIANPKKISNKIKQSGCDSIRSFAHSSLCFIEDNLYLVKGGSEEIFYSVNVRKVLNLQKEGNERYVFSLGHLLNFQLSDDGKKIFFFRAPHSEWEDNLKSVKNNQYFELSMAEGAVKDFFVPLAGSRAFIEAIHEKDEESIILVSKVDESGSKSAQYLLGFPDVQFSDYQVVRDYSPVTNSVFTVSFQQEDGNRVFVLEEMGLDGKIKKTDLKWISF